MLFLENASSTPVSGCSFGTEARRRCPRRPSSCWRSCSIAAPRRCRSQSILERLWPETFVADASLHNLVAEIRAALGDAPRASRYIRTVPRYGYAFHGEAQPAPAVADARHATSGQRLVSKSGEWLLSEGPNVVGRDGDCAIRIDSSTLSRRHARIVVTGREAVVEDLGQQERHDGEWAARGRASRAQGQRPDRRRLADDDLPNHGCRLIDHYAAGNVRTLVGLILAVSVACGGDPAAAPSTPSPAPTQGHRRVEPRLRGRVRLGWRRRLREVGLRAWLHPQQREAVLHVARRKRTS